MQPLGLTVGLRVKTIALETLPMLNGKAATIIEEYDEYDRKDPNKPWLVQFDHDNSKRAILAKQLTTKGIKQKDLELMERVSKKRNKKAARAERRAAGINSDEEYDDMGFKVQQSSSDSSKTPEYETPSELDEDDFE